MTTATFDMKAWKKAHYEANKDYYKAKSRARKGRLRYELLAVIVEHLEKNPCVDCGYAEIDILEFDHRPEFTKEFNVSNAMTNQVSPARLRAEIAKCDVRCPNCHRRMTLKRAGHGERNWETINAGLAAASVALRPSIDPERETARPYFMTLEGLANECASVGLADLDVAYWKQATDRGIFPYTVEGKRKRVKREDFNAWMSKHHNDATMSEAQFQAFVASVVKGRPRRGLTAAQ